MTGCEIPCNQENSIDLVCKTNDPSLVQWVHDELAYVLIGTGGWVVGNDCTLLFEPPDQPNAVTLTCPGRGSFSRDENGNLGFAFCSAQACPYSITLPYPEHCFPLATSWQVVNYGCQNENIVFVTLDTGNANLRNALGEYNVSDGEETYACVYLDNQPSRLYCYAPEPEALTQITFCLTINGVRECQTFAIDGSRFLPCLGQEPQPQPGDPCNQYNTPETCKEHVECEWDPSQQLCQSRP